MLSHPLCLPFAIISLVCGFCLKAHHVVVIVFFMPQMYKHQQSVERKDEIHQTRNRLEKVHITSSSTYQVWWQRSWWLVHVCILFCVDIHVCTHCCLCFLSCLPWHIYYLFTSIVNYAPPGNASVICRLCEKVMTGGISTSSLHEKQMAGCLDKPSIFLLSQFWGTRFIQATHE